MSFSSNKVRPSNIDRNSSQTLYNKTLKGKTVIQSGADLQTPSIINPLRLDPKRVANIAAAEAYAATAQNGELVYVEDIKKQFQVKDSALTEIAGGSGGINYIENSQFNEGINGVTGSANIAVSHETVAPLRGAGSLKLTKAAVDASTQQVLIPFTIDTADLSQMITISFDKDFSDADYADGHAQVRVIVDPDGAATTKRIEYGEDILGGKGSHLAQFQTDATELNYALAFYWNDNSTVAVEALIDNVEVGPRAVVKGAIVTEWESYDIAVTASTTNPTFGTNTKTSNWRRVGDNLEVKFTINQTTAGTAGSGTYFFSIPSGLTVDESKLSDSFGVGLGVVGSAHVYDNSVGELNGIARYEGGNIILQVGDQTTTSPVSSTYAQTSSDNIMRYSSSFSVPIQGWSSNQIQSQDLGGREVVVRATGNSGPGGGTVSSVEDIEFTTVEIDTTSSWTNDGNNSTGSTDAFVCPETGYYHVSGSVRLNATVGNIEIVSCINGSNSKTLGFEQGSGDIIPFDGIVPLTKGDLFTVRPTQPIVLNSNNQHHWIHIQKLASPQTILETETVAARYTSNSGQTINTSTTTTVICEDLGFDTHNAYNTSTGEYTVPATGYYQVNGAIQWNADMTFSTSLYDIYFLVNTSLVEQSRSSAKVVGSHRHQISMSSVLYLEKGDVVELGAYQNSGSNLQLDSSGPWNKFSIARLK